MHIMYTNVHCAAHILATLQTPPASSMGQIAPCEERLSLINISKGNHSMPNTTWQINSFNPL